MTMATRSITPISIKGLPSTAIISAHFPYSPMIHHGSYDRIDMTLTRSFDTCEKIVFHERVH